MAETKKVNSVIAELQIPEGYTTRKIKNTLQVVKKAAVVKKERKTQMSTQINVSIHPFGAYREQLWIGKIVEGEFVKELPLYKALNQVAGKKSYDGKFGKASTSEDWEITVPENFQGAIAKSRLNKDTVKVHTEYEILHA